MNKDFFLQYFIIDICRQEERIVYLSQIILMVYNVLGKEIYNERFKICNYKAKGTSSNFQICAHVFVFTKDGTMVKLYNEECILYTQDIFWFSVLFSYEMYSGGKESWGRILFEHFQGSTFRKFVEGINPPPLLV